MGRMSASERGDIVLGWLSKLAVVFALAGLVLFDTLSIGVTSVHLADHGFYAAHEASATWAATDDLQKAYLTATRVAAEQDPLDIVDPKTFRVDPDGTVHLRLSRTATTLWVSRVGPIAEWANIEREASGRSVS